MSKTLQQHIDDDRNELDNITTNAQRRRHLKDELKDLESYQKNHPEETRDPSPLELFCDSHPNSLECKIYEV